MKKAVISQLRLALCSFLTEKISRLYNQLFALVIDFEDRPVLQRFPAARLRLPGSMDPVVLA
jgi:hypothetical protein